MKLGCDNLDFFRYLLDLFEFFNQGGLPGSERLRDCEALQKMLEKQIEDNKPIGAICAAPVVVLDAHGWLKVCFFLH